MKNQDWTRDEHILALDFYLRHAPSIPGKNSLEVIQLSNLLNRMQELIGGTKGDNYRNPAGVYMKLMNFRRFDPAYKGAGLAHGNKDEEVVWTLFSSNPIELSRLASHIACFAGAERTDELASLPQLVAAEDEADEGELLSRVHRYRERNRGLIDRKKKKFLANHDRLFCEACGFDFEKVYGERGKEFIECHHTKPVSQLEVGEKTKLSDLVMLCSNCHRMVHRRKPWLPFEALKAQIESSTHARS
ncbi:HNH endonuclease [Hydrogenophaga sp. OTU3427]|uniref:HNH endonuclease n=1 Tax=Hydrogenophaga sp. OTU3427 TaxID=3043856 RepID=UPI00313DFDBD